MCSNMGGGCWVEISIPVHDGSGAEIYIRARAVAQVAAKVLADSAAAVWSNARVEGRHGPLFTARWAACGGCSACALEAAGQTEKLIGFVCYNEKRHILDYYT